MSAYLPLLDVNGESLSSAQPLAYARAMNPEADDSALMLRYGDGDIAAFETLYRRYKDSLYRYLLRLSMHPVTAEDVFQETWGKIIKARASYRPTAKFSTFLYRVAHNCFIDYVRRNKRHDHAGNVDPDTRGGADNEPEEYAELYFAERRLRVALAQLPEEQRDVFLLFEEAGLSTDEIAKITGVNRETAKSRLRYAVAKLKSRLAETESEDLEDTA